MKSFRYQLFDAAGLNFVVFSGHFISCKPGLSLRGTRPFFSRCGHPGQQQGRLLPSVNSSQARWIRCFRVSSVLHEVTQHIHSLRANGVISSQAVFAVGEANTAFRKSDGIACIVDLLCFFLPLLCALVRLTSTSSSYKSVN